MNRIDRDKKIKFPAQIDAEKDEILFIETSKHELDTLPFHDNRLNMNKTVVSSRKFLDINLKKPKNTVSYIFHIAFCGSTFLSKLLGQKHFSIREPNVFMNLANLIRVNTRFINDQQLFNAWVSKTLLLFSKQIDADKNIVFKPTNASNNIINNLLNCSENSKAIFLYSDIDSYLVSILKKGEAGKAFIRNQYNIFSLDKSPFASTDFRKVNTFTDLQIACLVWSMQMYEYQQISQSKYKNRIKFLETSSFLNDPRKAVLKISQFFGSELEASDLSQLDKMGMFDSHSKHKQQSYNTDIRKQEILLVKQKYKQEFIDIHEWLSKSMKLPPIPSQNLHLNLE